MLLPDLSRLSLKASPTEMQAGPAAPPNPAQGQGGIDWTAVLAVLGEIVVAEIIKDSDPEFICKQITLYCASNSQLCQGNVGAGIFEQTLAAMGFDTNNKRTQLRQRYNAQQANFPAVLAPIPNDNRGLFNGLCALLKMWVDGAPAAALAFTLTQAHIVQNANGLDAATQADVRANATYEARFVVSCFTKLGSGQAMRAAAASYIQESATVAYGNFMAVNARGAQILGNIVFDGANGMADAARLMPWDADLSPLLTDRAVEDALEELLNGPNSAMFNAQFVNLPVAQRESYRVRMELCELIIRPIIGDAAWQREQDKGWSPLSREPIAMLTKAAAANPLRIQVFGRNIHNATHGWMMKRVMHHLRFRTDNAYAFANHDDFIRNGYEYKYLNKPPPPAAVTYTADEIAHAMRTLTMPWLGDAMLWPATPPDAPVMRRIGTFWCDERFANVGSVTATIQGLQIWFLDQQPNARYEPWHRQVIKDNWYHFHRVIADAFHNNLLNGAPVWPGLSAVFAADHVLTTRVRQAVSQAMHERTNELYMEITNMPMNLYGTGLVIRQVEQECGLAPNTLQPFQNQIVEIITMERQDVPRRPRWPPNL